MEKVAWDGPKCAPRVFFFISSANPDLANILGRAYLDFVNVYVCQFLDPKFLDPQVPRFLKSGPGMAWARPGLA